MALILGVVLLTIILFVGLGLILKKQNNPNKSSSSNIMFVLFWLVVYFTLVYDYKYLIFIYLGLNILAYITLELLSFFGFLKEKRSNYFKTLTTNYEILILVFNLVFQC